MLHKKRKETKIMELFNFDESFIGKVTKSNPAAKAQRSSYGEACGGDPACLATEDRQILIEANMRNRFWNKVEE